MLKHKDRHHRKPSSRGGRTTPGNISVVPISKHRAYHQLFGNMIPKELCAELTKTWIDPDYYLVAVPRKKARTLKKKGKLYILVELEI